MTKPLPPDRDPGDEPDRADGQPGGAAGKLPRDPRLAGFVRDGEWDRQVPGPELVAVLTEVCGPEWRCPGAEPEELVGVLRRCSAVESWAAAAKLGVIRELIRQDDLPFLNGPRHRGLPSQWSESLTHEITLALASSAQAADKLMRTACELASRLPATGKLLAAGIVTLPKAGLIAEVFQDLSDEDAARAEEELVPQLAGPTGKTYGQVERLATAIAAKIDPALAERQRKAAERERSRVQLFRERSGTAALSGRDLPTDETLAAYANVNARTGEYKESGAFPGARMDQLRAIAYLDLLNGITADARIAHAIATAEAEDQAEAETESGTGTGGRAEPAGQAGPVGWPDPAGDPDDCSCGECDPGCCDPGDDGPDDDDDPGNGGPGGGPSSDGQGADDLDDDSPSDVDPGDSDLDAGGPGGHDPFGGGPGDAGLDEAGPGDVSPEGQASNPDLDPDQDQDQELVVRSAAADLVIPLLTLLGLTERPGEGHGLGPLDPGLCRDLAAIAANWPGSRWCLTITDPDGIAIGHGCAKPARYAKPGRAARTSRGKPPPGAPATSLTALPARVNLTIPLSALQGLRGPDRPLVPWMFVPRGDPDPDSPNNAGTSDGPDKGHGTWMLRLPGGREFTVTPEPMPTYSCDHRHESHAYKPNDALRHLVQIRDWECTFPPCSRHARESDFEHCVPYGKGGRTCACNAGARSRKCHRVKQSPGWNVTQPRPGWHQWTTPAGWIYVQGPKRYPA